MRTTRPLAVFVATLSLAGLSTTAIGVDEDCDRVRWLLELESIDPLDDGSPNPFEDSWWTSATLEPLGEAGPETLALLARDGVIYATVDALTIEAGDSLGCTEKARVYTCEAGPRTNQDPYAFPLVEGTPAEGSLEQDTGTDAGPNDLRITVRPDTVGIVVPSSQGAYTVVYTVTGSEVY